jgi:protein involved in polysaccharide export with SLBB domain
MSEASNNEPKLPVHEWLAVVVVIILMVMISSVVIFSDHDSSSIETGPPHHVMNPEIDVTVEGAVSNPGTFKLKRDAKLQDALDMAKPIATADLSKIKPNKKLRPGQAIKIAEVKMITVYVKGKVEEPLTIHLTKGARLRDIIEHVKFNDDVDVNKYQKMRYLKDRETIVIK